ncbi:MAG: PepSY-like domain-containing protein [Tannerellaceae bacterium]|jgi:hypothetical protein|nr:PepSY-like domain-containing protein [Tannerellaceae bacterium]
MKTTSILTIVLSAWILLGFISCNDDNNYVPEYVVVNAFKSKYPGAKRVEWETKSGYKVAEFQFNRKETEAWFSADGEWIMTDTDIPYNELPGAVQDSFRQSTYGGWRVDDVDKIERSNTETIYIIEVEKGEIDVDLYYSEDGTLVKEINDNGNIPNEPPAVSNSIIEKVKEMYPNARFELESGNSEVYLTIKSDGTITSK